MTRFHFILCYVDIYQDAAKPLNENLIYHNVHGFISHRSHSDMNYLLHKFCYNVR